MNRNSTVKNFSKFSKNFEKLKFAQKTENTFVVTKFLKIDLFVVKQSKN